MEWQADHISSFVDGDLQDILTEHATADFAYSAENSSMSVGMQTFWNNDALDGQNWITITITNATRSLLRACWTPTGCWSPRRGGAVQAWSHNHSCANCTVRP